MERKRVTIKYKSPNPLFEKWLTKWRDEAKEQNSKMQFCYSLALKSLCKYPLPLENGRQCKILSGFGDKLCAKLDDALKKHIASGLPMIPEDFCEDMKQKNLNKRKVSKKTPKSKKDQPELCDKEYVPSVRSGGYAILVALYELSLNIDYDGFSSKDEIIKSAQIHCDCSFTRPQPGTFYTAWSSMKTLIDKGLVKKESNPAKYSLTDKGIVIGHKLFRDGKKKQRSFDEFFGRSNTDEIIDSNVNLNENDSDDKLLEDNFIGNNCLNSSLKNICGTFGSNTQLSPKPSTSKDNVSEEIVTKSSNSKKASGKSKEKILKKCATEEFKDVILAPNTFDIILLVDNCETVGKKSASDDRLLQELNNFKLKYEVRNLKVGDYAWICRDRRNSDTELVLPYIVERKRVDDLSHSIVDGRFHEQKFRLRKSGIQNIIYLIEEFNKKAEHLTIPYESLYQAAVNTMIHDQFLVKFSDHLRGSAEYLAFLTKIIVKNFKGKTIVSCPKENLSSVSIQDDLISLMAFKEFNKGASKSKSFTVKEMLTKHLLKINGVSLDKALAITNIYPTPLSLAKALSDDTSKNGSVIADIKHGKLEKKVGPVLGDRKSVV